MTERLRAKVAQRATRTSDVTRARTLAIAALGAALGAGATLAIGTTPTGGARPLARPHAQAKLACATCHEAPAFGTPSTPSTRRTPSTLETPGAPSHAAAGACKACHAAAQHGSARPAHRALAARGVLTCATCHPAHEGAQGVTFGDDGSFVRWGAGALVTVARERGRSGGAAVKAGVTVPIVALAACATCHDPTSAKDPIARCVAAEVRTSADAGAGLARTASLCFDEHRPRAGGWRGRERARS